MKIREALAARRSDMRLTGEVGIDGLYALGHVRPKNRKEDRVDRRLPENQSPDRVVVMAIRERRKGGQSVTRITRARTRNARGT
jgi:hypothetical protein